MKIGIVGANIAAFAEREPAIMLARTAEAAGVESLWTYEHILVPARYHSTYPYSSDGRMPAEGADLADALDWIAFLTGATERLIFATGVLVLPEHNPVMVAKRAATIDRLSAGRLLLGVGAGWLKEEFDALGVAWPQRGRRTDEYIDVIRSLWTADNTTFEGAFVHLDDVRCFPKPLRASGVPIIIGGHSDTAATRAGRIGDGFYPAAPAEQVAELVRTMKRSAEHAGRDPETIEVTASAGTPWNLDEIKRYQDLGVARVNVALPTRDPADLDRALDALHHDIISTMT